MKKAINDFVQKYGIPHKEDESMAHIELMMYDHLSVTWKDKDYYIPMDHSDYNLNEEYLLIMDYLEIIRFD